MAVHGVGVEVEHLVSHDHLVAGTAGQKVPDRVLRKSQVSEVPADGVLHPQQ